MLIVSQLGVNFLCRKSDKTTYENCKINLKIARPD